MRPNPLIPECPWLKLGPVSTETSGSSLGTGGMNTKLIAAELATGAGVATVICHGAKPHDLLTIATATPPPPDPSEPALLGPSMDAPQDLSRPLHTLFMPKAVPLSDRKFWIAHGLLPRGDVVVDAGAHRAIARDSGGRLLAAGVIRVSGGFMAGQAVRIWASRSHPGADKTIVDGTPLDDDSPAGSIADLRSSGTLVDVPKTDGPLGRSPSLTGLGELVEVGRGLANYHASEIDRIKGLKSSQIEAVLGHIDSEHVVDGIALLQARA